MRVKKGVTISLQLCGVKTHLIGCSETVCFFTLHENTMKAQ